MRANNDFLNVLINQEVEMEALDKGFVKVIDYMGDDEAIVAAARLSYKNNNSNVLRSNHSLIEYLITHSHTSPFEMCELKLHLKMPIFVARQWHRHRTASINEISARYTELKDEIFIPDANDFTSQSEENKQGRSEDLIQDKINMRKKHEQSVKNSYSQYKEFIDKGVNKEIARTVLSLSTYTEFFWKIDLHNLLHFVKLRSDSHAQPEIRVYANIIASILECWVPYTYDAFNRHVLKGIRLSRDETDIIKLFNKSNKELLSIIELYSNSIDNPWSERKKKEIYDKILPLVRGVDNAS